MRVYASKYIGITIYGIVIRIFINIALICMLCTTMACTTMKVNLYTISISWYCRQMSLLPTYVQVNVYLLEAFYGYIVR